MADLAHWWGDDLSLTPSGDLALVDGLDRDNQHIFRRLCTNGAQSGAKLSEYIWEPNYGGSAPWYVGQTGFDELMLSAVIRGQMHQEASVSHDPEPTITVTVNPNGTYQASISYTNVSTSQRTNLLFDSGS